MANNVRSVDFLPEIFQTPVNQQFLAATLDQLIQEPAFKKSQGFIGRRIGPGVNANDRYVVEPTAVRNNYQLEPGVCQINPDNTRQVIDAITYPGINDALALQGAVVNNPSDLYKSDYYTWDPFVDFDKFINYAQYYWVPGGPDAVTVSATGVPTFQNYTVTRNSNGYYTFSGVRGNNPTLTLARQGSYNFNIAQNDQVTVQYRVTNNGTTAWTINYDSNPTLSLVRGNTYIFNLSLSAPLPFYIKTELSFGSINQYNNGVSRNGSVTGLITFTVPQDAPDTLYYCSSTEFNMRGQFDIVDAVDGTGPDFWIQSSPGINGVIPATPNITSRDVYGVVNNGIDLGIVTFNTPTATEQSFYYNLPQLGSIPNQPPGTVDLVVNLGFNQINNIYVDTFLDSNPNGIDGITNLNGRTVFFPNSSSWIVNGQYDVPPQPYDAATFSNLEEITNPAVQYGIWLINYVPDVDGRLYISLTSILSVPNLTQCSVLFGTQYASTRWYKNSSGFFVTMPALTAVQDILYYQDSQDPTMIGVIKLVDVTVDAELKIDDIIGKTNYTSPNGVTFTNGLKVLFTGITVPDTYSGNEYYVEGVGTAIQLLPVTDFVTPETYIPGSPVAPDYLTINRAGPDLNPWSRSNRWFHVDVVEQTAQYNSDTNPPVLDQAFRAKRPILEFRAGTRLFDFGTQGLQPVNIVDFSQEDALTTVEGQEEFITDGYTVVQGSTIIFAGDEDLAVRNKVYQVEFITPDTIPPLIPEPIINLVPIATVVYDQTTVCLDGDTLTGVSFYFDGVNWLQTQQKTSVNQAPLFNIYNASGVSFGNQSTYPSSNFVGSKLFSYAVGTGSNDVVLGFPLSYLNLSNIGDIVFDNNLYSDSFNYTSNSQGFTTALSTGFVRQYQDRIVFQREIGWQDAAVQSQIRQQFRFAYDGRPLQLDLAVNANTVVPAIQIFVNANFLEPYDTATGDYTYSYTTTATTTTITLRRPYVVGDLVEIQVLSDQISATAFYQVPVNLENNPFNGNSNQFTLGTARNHYSTIGQNLINLEGPVIGNNNSRDLGNIVPYGLQILQQSAPLTLAGYFLRSEEYNIFNALQFNSREYIKFKSLLLNTSITNDFVNLTIPQIVDQSIAIINAGDTSISPFYWSDMLPTGTTVASNSTTVTPITIARFNTVQTYDFTTSNYLGLLVYVNDRLLARGVEYVVGDGTPTLTILIPLVVGDVVTINEYNPTYGNFVPNTPTKLGLYPKYIPRIYISTDYVRPTPVIQGHDGSITVAFGDIRDQVLLEFENRIYSNLKTDGNPVPITVEQVLPGFFRTTDYTEAEITKILGEDFLIWVGLNKLDYTAQDYLTNNPFTYNYSTAGNRINNAVLDQGAWRGIYRYFYDTMTPNTTPWEMLGFTEKPIWWEDRYGPVPYTSDNLVLWGDLEQGLVADPVAPYIKPNFARPGLTTVIPVNSLGELLPPLESVVGLYNPNDFRKSWTVGDGGPVEASWWMSSSYPFAVMRLLALTRPAEFFALFADRDLYRYNAELEQYLYNNRYRLDGNGLEIYGNGVSKASYINWIIDYNQQRGINSTTALTTDLANLDVRLCYRMAAWTDQQYLEVYLEKSSPDSQNESLQIPPESYNLLVYRDQPYAQITYSSVVVETVENGWAVYGYGSYQPYFPIIVSAVNGKLQTVSAGGATVQVPAQYTNNVTNIPYGYVFTNRTMMVDFLLSYGQYLESQGMTFTELENGYTLNWPQMAQEFLYFSQQGWQTGTLINLNPAAGQLTAYRLESVVDDIYSYSPENQLLDQNRQTIPTRDLIIQREGNSFKINPEPTANQAISFLNLRFTDYENIVIFDNVDIFNDLIYDPVTGARQSRMYLNAFNTVEWNGTLDAKGFILNQNNVKAWNPNLRYTKGDIVRYKNTYWQASGLVQPKTKFDYNDWLKSNYALIEQGLLPNLANKADQLANTYNTQTANLNNNNDLLAYNLIGFTPRQYMADLNLDDVTQVNLYQQFIKVKGTTRATDLFTRVNLTKESGNYQIYETWGVLIGTYGANSNRSYFEINLNEAKLTGSPSTVQIILPGQTSQANQTVLLNNLWSESYNITSTDILPTIYPSSQNTALPSAGYVNIDDVDITVYTLDDPSAIAANLNTVGTGTSIWVARDNPYNWNIYRCTQIPGKLTQITDNLNSTSIAQFSQITTLAVGDLIIVRYFADGVDGVYRVLGRPSPTSIIIAYAFTNNNQTTLTGNGLGWFLQTMRVSQASDVATLPYANALVPGARAWVDDNGSGHWEVLEKQAPFTLTESKNAVTPQTNSLYGTSIGQSTNHYSLLVGSPSAADGGAVYTYRRIASAGNAGTYANNIVLSLPAEDVAGYGNSLEWGDNNWAVIGASTSRSGQGYASVVYQIPGSNNYEQTQLLTALSSNAVTTNAVAFGSAVAMSKDERWMYVSAPVENLVYAYGKVEIPEQSVTYTTDGTSTAYAWSPDLIIDPAYPEQLAVILDNQPQSYPADYTIPLDSSNVVFATAPPAGVQLEIARRAFQSFDGTGSGDPTYDLQPYLYTATVGNTATNINSCTITVDGIIQRPWIDYVFSDDGNVTFNSGSEPASAAVINVTAGTYWQYVTTLPTAGLSLSANAVFGTSLATSTDGRSIIVGTQNDTAVNAAGNTVTAGSTYVFDRSVVRYVVTDTAQTIYAIPGTSIDPISVLHNDVFLTNEAQYVPGQFSVVGSNIELASSVTLTIGDSIEIETNEFQFVQKIVSQAPQNGARFGNAVAMCSNNCSLYSGAPSNTNVIEQDGSVERQANQSRLYGVTVSTIANPTLTPGTTIRINNIEVAVPNSPNNTVSGLATAISPVAWSITKQYYINDRVIYNYVCYIATASSSEKVPSSSSAYWDASFVIPNVQASLTADLEFTGDGITKIFFVGTVYSTAGSTPVVYVNNALSSGYTYNNTSQQIEFVSAPAIGVKITVVTGRLILSTINNSSAPEFNKLTVLPGVGGTGSAFAELGFNTFIYTQTLYSPNPVGYSSFGSAISINTDSVNIVIGAPNGSVYEAMSFDGGETIVDDNSTFFSNPVSNCGVAYTFDYLPSAQSSVSNTGQLVFGQQIYQLPRLDTFTFVGDGTTRTYNINSVYNTITNPPQVYLNNELLILGPDTYDYAYYSSTYFVVFATAPSTNSLIFIETGQAGTSIADRFGTAVNYVDGRLIVGAPGVDLGASSNTNYGSMSIFDNNNNLPSWAVIHEQQPVVNIELMNSVYSFDKLLNSTQTYYDFIDPLQGKILGVAARNINYIGAVDPANYNTGTIHNNGTAWGSAHVGEIWWDTDTVRFINPNQDDIVYASKRWGQIFPGSRVDIYQWIQSDVPPASYIGIGTPLSATSYTVSSILTANGVFASYYYYWVRGINTVDTANGKNLSTTAIASYIANPLGSGLPYIAALNSSTVALYNAVGLISAQDTILHIEYERQIGGANANIHTEYQFVNEGKADSFVTDSIYQKLQDSLCGEDVSGNLVPDPFLSPGLRYGVQFRPRQSMFVNRYTALQNYLGRANTILAQYPISELRTFNLLNSSESIPNATTATATAATISGNILTVAGTITGVFALGQTISGTGIPGLVTILDYGTGTGGEGTYTISASLSITARTITGTTGYNQVVSNLTVLGYQNLAAVNLGYRYLVLTDSSQGGRWTIYEVVTDPLTDITATRTTLLVRIQNYDTSLYWSYINWNQPGYNSSIQPVAQVAITADLQALSINQAPIGSSVQVNNNGQGKYEIYLRIDTGWERVVLEDGTIAFDAVLWNYALGPYGFSAEVYDAQYFDQAPTIETRKIIQAINQELFTNEFLIYRNELLILMFKYIYSEFTAPVWLMKSSFINVDHKLRALEAYQLYQQDNQTFVEQYLQEVKPYHVQTLAFNLVYDGLDLYPGSMSDFDVPARWDNTVEIPQFVSPVLTPYTDSVSLVESFVSDTAPNAAIWTETPWQSWFNNYTLSIIGATVVTGGSGYNVVPEVVFGTEWQADTVYTIGQQIFYVSGPTNNLYTVTASGTTGNIPPSFTSGSALNGTATLSWFGNGASGYATLSGTGGVQSVIVSDPGSGYTTTAAITFVGGNGTGAQAVPIMTNQLVRNFTITIRFDRYQYETTIYEWQANYSYAQGDRVRWHNLVWSANSAVSSATFNIDQWTDITIPVDAVDIVAGNTYTITSLGTVTSPTNFTLIGASQNIVGTPFIATGAGTGTGTATILLSGVDRTMGYYTPTPNMLGLSLPLLIAGDHYPGVQVMAPNFDQDIIADPDILDAVYSSSYLDTFLGTRPTDINVDGGGYIDVFSSYAPEELVPGSEFDTLDFRVYTTGGPTNGADFRIFQDMRGLQLTYIINDETTTELAQDLGTTDDIIYVDNAGALAVPNLASNRWGVLTVGAERIMYREIDLANNTVSGLLRGTAGTAITAHIDGATVYNMGTDNLFSQQYQNYIVETTTVANGSTTVFAAPNITLSTSTTAWVIGNTYTSGDIVINSGSFYSAKQNVPAGTAIANTDYWQPLAVAVEVYVGGLRITGATTWVIGNTYSFEDIVVNSGSFYSAKQNVPAGTAISNTDYWQPLSTPAEAYIVTNQAPVSVTLNTAPPDGVAVTILVRRGTWIDY